MYRGTLPVSGSGDDRRQLHSKRKGKIALILQEDRGYDKF